MLADGRPQVDEVGGVDRVGLVVRERAVELEVHRHDLEPGEVEDGGDGVPGHAVAGVDDDGERAVAVERDQSVQVGGVVAQRVAVLDPAARRDG